MRGKTSSNSGIKSFFRAAFGGAAHLFFALALALALSACVGGGGGLDAHKENWDSNPGVKVVKNVPASGSGSVNTLTPKIQSSVSTTVTTSTEKPEIGVRIGVIPQPPKSPSPSISTKVDPVPASTTVTTSTAKPEIGVRIDIMPQPPKSPSPAPKPESRRVSATVSVDATSTIYRHLTNTITTQRDITSTSTATIDAAATVTTDMTVSTSVTVDVIATVTTDATSITREVSSITITTSKFLDVTGVATVDATVTTSVISSNAVSTTITQDIIATTTMTIDETAVENATLTNTTTVTVTSTVENPVTTTVDSTVTVQSESGKPSGKSFVQTISVDSTISVARGDVSLVSLEITRLFVTSVRVLTLSAQAQQGAETLEAGDSSMYAGFLGAPVLYADEGGESVKSTVTVATITVTNTISQTVTLSSEVSVTTSVIVSRISVTATTTNTVTVHPSVIVTTHRTVETETVTNTLYSTITVDNSVTVTTSSTVSVRTVTNEIAKFVTVVPTVETTVRDTIFVRTIKTTQTITTTIWHTTVTTSLETAERTVDVTMESTNSIYVLLSNHLHTVTNRVGSTVFLLPDGEVDSAVLPPLKWSGPVTLTSAEYTANIALRKMSAAIAYDPRNNHLGQDVTIAMIGGGISLSHGELNGNIIASSGFAPTVTGGIGGDSDATGHALAIAARMNGQGLHGVAPEAKILPLQIGNATATASALPALRHAAASGVQIVNNGWGFTQTIPVHYDREKPPYYPTLRILNAPVMPELLSLGFGDAAFYRGYFAEMKDIVGDRDMVIVHPAGDGGWNDDYSRIKISMTSGSPVFSSVKTQSAGFVLRRYSFVQKHPFFAGTPAEQNRVSVLMGDLLKSRNQTGIVGLAPLYESDLIGRMVVAVAVDNENNTPSYSNACGRARHWCIAAPGYDPRASGDVDTPGSTTYAAAYVSGALAVLRSRFPGVPMKALLAILFKTADDPYDLGIDELYGHGIINLGAALSVRGSVDLVIPGAREAAGSFAAPALTNVVLSSPNASTGLDYGTGEYQWSKGVSLVNAHMAHDHGYFGQGVTVAMINYNISRFGLEIESNRVHHFNFTNPGGRLGRTVESDRWLLALLAAAKNGIGLVGIAPRADIMPLYVKDSRHWGATVEVDDSQAYRHAAERNVPIAQVKMTFAQSVTARRTGASTTSAAVFPVIPKLLSMDVGSMEHHRNYLSGVNSILDGRDMVMVWAAGDNGWNSESGTATVSLDGIEIAGTAHAIADLGLAANQPGIMGYAPLYHEDLQGKWVVAVAVRNESRDIASFSNGCGAAKFWCVAAPGGDELQSIFGINNHNLFGSQYVKGTEVAAIHVSGALAVLRSRFPALPMSAVLAILLKTSTDLGEKGVDEVYGHGMINLAAAISAQGSFNLIINESAVSMTSTVALRDINAEATLYVDAAGMPASVVLPSHAEWTGDIPKPGDYGGNHHALSVINADVPRLHGYHGQSVTIALIGGGISTAHRDLTDNLLEVRSYVSMTATAQEENEIGAGIAGIIAAKRGRFGDIGVAPKARIKPYRIAGTSTATLAIGAFRDANERHTPVVLFWKAGSEILANNDPVFRVLEKKGAAVPTVNGKFFADIAGMLQNNGDDLAVVTPAGDGGWNSVNGTVSLSSVRVTLNNAVNTYHLGSSAASVNQPELIGLAPLYEEDLLGRWVAVAAADRDGVIAASSNGCGEAKFWCLAAPGKDVFTTAPAGYSNRSGTAYAAAYVSGALAVLKSKFPAMPMNALVAIMLKTAADKGAPGIDEVYGHGMLDLGKAITVQGGMDLSIPGAAAVAGTGKRRNTVSLFLPAPNPTSTVEYDTVEYGNNKGLSRINAKTAYQRGYFGQGVTIGIAGSGWKPDHAELTANAVAGTNFIDSGTVIYDADGEGTHVAGIIAAELNGDHIHGVAPQARIMPLQIIGSTGIGYSEKLSFSQSAIRHAAGRNVPIVNNGFDFAMRLTLVHKGAPNEEGLQSVFPSYPAGSVLFSLGFQSEEIYRNYFRGVKNIVKDRDMVMVAEAGDGGWNGVALDGWNSGAVSVRLDSVPSGHNVIHNAGYLNSTYRIRGVNGRTHGIRELASEHGGNQVGIMGLAPLYESALVGKWVVVAAANKRNEIAGFSNGCGAAKHWCLTAPGHEEIYATNHDGGHSGAHGTDIAAAHVSGALAVLRSRLPHMPMSAILAILFKTAQDKGDVGVDDVYGHGMLDLGKAITVQGGMNLGGTPVAASVAGTGNRKNTVSLFLPAPNPTSTVEYDTVEYGNNKGLSRINAKTAYQHGYFGQGVTIGIAGSGWKPDHAELTANAVAGTNFIDSGTVIYDADGEGTHVAGIIAADLNGSHIHGVAPQARIMPLQIIGSTGIGYSEKLSFSQSAIRHAAGRNVPIVNNGFDFAMRLTTISKFYPDNNDYKYAFPSYPAGSVLFSLGLQSEEIYRNYFRSVKNIVKDRDMVMVAEAGDGSWNGVLRGGWKQGTGRMQLDATQANHQVYKNVQDLIEDFLIQGVNGRTHGIRELASEHGGNNVGIMGLAPLYESALVGKWVVVAAANKRNEIAWFSNGCGAAKHWCLTAPGQEEIYATNHDGGHSGAHGTDIAAAHVSGALAVLRSRLPHMPMSAILAILFKTAQDKGDVGVDDVYGHGMLDLGKAITLQGSINIAMPDAVSAAGSREVSTSAAAPETTGLNGLRVMNLSDTHFSAGFSGLANRLSGMSVAVSYLGGEYYYDAALPSLTDFHIDDAISLGNAAGDMFDAPRKVETDWGLAAVADHYTGRIKRAGMRKGDFSVEYDICADCEKSSWKADEEGGIGSAYFAENQQGFGVAWSPWANDDAEIEVFSALGLGEDGGEETHRQHGLRWKDGFKPGFSWVVEMSEIREEGSMLGSYGDILGIASSKSRQIQMELSGEVSAWRWKGGITQGWTDAELSGAGLLADVSDVTYRQWHVEAMAQSLLQGEDEFRMGVASLPQIKGDVRLDYYRAGDEVFLQDFQFSLPIGVTAESMRMKKLSDSALILRTGYKWRAARREDIWAAAGFEAIQGNAESEGYQATFQLRWHF